MRWTNTDTSPVLTVLQKQDYSLGAGTLLPASGFSGPRKTKAHERPHTIAGAFFMPAMSFYGGCAWDIERCAGVPLSQSANLRTAVTITRLAASGDGSTKIKGTITMTPILRLKSVLNPSAKQRAAAHRKMALAALSSDTSIKHRLNRYNAHMSKARLLDGGV